MTNEEAAEILNRIRSEREAEEAAEVCDYCEDPNCSITDEDREEMSYCCETCAHRDV